MKIHLNANRDEVGGGEHLSDMFTVHSGLKKCLSQWLFDLTLECAIKNETRRNWKWMEHSGFYGSVCWWR